METAGMGNSEKGDMEGKQEKGDLGFVIHSYTISMHYSVIKLKKQQHQLRNCLFQS